LSDLFAWTTWHMLWWVLVYCNNISLSRQCVWSDFYSNIMSWIHGNIKIWYENLMARVVFPHFIRFYLYTYQRGQTQRHRLWFSTKTVRFSSSNWIWRETYALKIVWCSTNVYVSRLSQIQFQDEDHAVYISFRW